MPSQLLRPSNRGVTNSLRFSLHGDSDGSIEVPTSC